MILIPKEEINPISLDEFILKLKSLAEKVKKGTNEKSVYEKIEIFENAIKEFYVLLLSYYMKKYNVSKENLTTLVRDTKIVITIFPNYEDLLIFYIDVDENERCVIKWSGFILKKEIIPSLNIYPVIYLNNKSIKEIFNFSLESLKDVDAHTLINDWLYNLYYRFETIANMGREIGIL